MRILIALLTLMSIGCSVTGNNSSSGEKLSLATLKSLEGYWQTKPDVMGKKEVVIYKLTSGGSALQEMLFPGTDHEMVSMYSQDGDTVKMTHYCAVGNQPELKAEALSPDRWVFRFAGGANLNPEKDMHMHEMRLFFKGPDRIRQEWVGFQEGKEDDVKILELERKIAG